MMDMILLQAWLFIKIVGEHNAAVKQWHYAISANNEWLHLQ